MVVYLTAIKDDLTGFSAPMQNVSVPAAMRDFADAVLNNERISKHISDFSLWMIGTYDIDNGTLVADKRILCTADEVRSGNYAEN